MWVDDDEQKHHMVGLNTEQNDHAEPAAELELHTIISGEVQ
jgi:hypothetical protein